MHRCLVFMSRVYFSWLSYTTRGINNLLNKQKASKYDMWPIFCCCCLYSFFFFVHIIYRNRCDFQQIKDLWMSCWSLQSKIYLSTTSQWDWEISVIERLRQWILQFVRRFITLQWLMKMCFSDRIQIRHFPKLNPSNGVLWTHVIKPSSMSICLSGYRKTVSVGKKDGMMCMCGWKGVCIFIIFCWIVAQGFQTYRQDFVK